MSDTNEPKHNLFYQGAYAVDKAAYQLIDKTKFGTELLQYAQTKDTPKEREGIFHIDNDAAFDAVRDVLATHEAKSGLPTAVDKKPATVGFKFI